MLITSLTKTSSNDRYGRSFNKVLTRCFYVGLSALRQCLTLRFITDSALFFAREYVEGCFYISGIPSVCLTWKIGDVMLPQFP